MWCVQEKIRAAASAAAASAAGAGAASLAAAAAAAAASLVQVSVLLALRCGQRQRRCLCLGRAPGTYTMHIHVHASYAMSSETLAQMLQPQSCNHNLAGARSASECERARLSVAAGGERSEKLVDKSGNCDGVIARL